MQCGEDGVDMRKSGLIVQNDVRAFGIAGDWEATAL